MTPKQLARVVELCGELEEIMKAGTTFIYGDDGSQDIMGILIADREVTDAIMGQQAAEDLN